MRIRKRSTSSTSISTGHENGGEEEFLLPLVAAAMNVQRAEDRNKFESEGDHHGNHTTVREVHPRPAHNWRNALQIQHSGEENYKNQAIEDGGDGKRADHKWKGSTRNEWDKIDIGVFTKKGTEGAILMKNDTSSSAEKEIMGGRDEEWKLPKSGRLDMGSPRRQRKNVSAHSVKRKRSKIEIGCVNGWQDETKNNKKPRQEDVIKMDDRRYNNGNYNEAEGSQCRRRNGRGWRCSQRTLVGYSLCEHHLGKGRLRSINSKNKDGINTGIVNNKGGTCKLKELRLIDASRSCDVRVNPDQQNRN